MFLVRIINGRKPRVFRLDENEAAEGRGVQKRRPRAWFIRTDEGTVLGLAAIGDSVDQTYGLLDELRARKSAGEAE